ncbi:hypothetical protein CYQ88_08310 [Hydrogenovibrio sp. SC-1]|uniref:integrative conjugative element protein, RAQPRD family n=1 Tax=Hydrogenovibrio sp. SC-1 TaxID=2065820 RepID=UPI000C7DC055|nr:RAQPRD family integrative conjugative element protein [Hydrogenovibrio sp. SC-1]PLA73957.1 hypothetical protein CYQ88_08310 [Hydrogenovibrio sp. SC-1]
MNKLRLISLIFFGTSLLAGCSTSGDVKHKNQEVSKTPIQPPVNKPQYQANKVEVLPLDSTTQLRPVSIKPSFYSSYEASDMSSSERKALLNIVSHLQEINILIRTAETQQNPDQRIKFRYDWLRKDLYKINRGISDHLSSPESQPRSFEPVMGEYRR